MGQDSYNVDEYSFDFYFQAIIAGNYIIKDVLSREVLEIDYLDQSRYNAKVRCVKKGHSLWVMSLYFFMTYLTKVWSMDSNL